MTSSLLAFVLSACPAEVEAERRIEARVEAACRTAPGCAAHLVETAELPETLEAGQTADALSRFPAEVLVAP